MTQAKIKGLRKAALLIKLIVKSVPVFMMRRRRRHIVGTASPIPVRPLAAMRRTRMIFLHLVKPIFLLGRQIPASELIFADPREDFLPRLQIQAADVVGDLWVVLENFVPVVPVHNGVVPDKKRGQNFTIGQNVFFELFALILGQRRNLCLELGVNVQCLLLHLALLSSSRGGPPHGAGPPGFAVPCSGPTKPCAPRGTSGRTAPFQK